MKNIPTVIKKSNAGLVCNGKPIDYLRPAGSMFDSIHMKLRFTSDRSLLLAFLQNFLRAWRKEDGFDGFPQR